MKLSRDEKQFVFSKETIIENINRTLDIVKTCADKFKVGDYVVAYWPAQTIEEGYDEDRGPQLIIGAYNIAQKYQVVYVDEYKIPYIKKLNKNNKPYGSLACPIRLQPDVDDCEVSFILEIDPDYTDAILLDDEANFNATINLKDKADIRQGIIEHNKKIKIKLDDVRDVQTLYDRIKPGDILWRSTKSSISVVEVIIRPKVSGGVIRSLKVLTNRNKEIIYRTSQLVNMNLYADQPKNFSELRNPK